MDTCTQSRNVVELSEAVADRLGLAEHARRDLETAALFRDIGNLAIPHDVIEKPGSLTDEEWSLIHAHTMCGQELLDSTPGVSPDVGRIVRATHERWDGLGYPDGLSGPSIPIEARIIACCDAFDAMTSERCYRLPMSQEVALRELVDCAGSQFDPHVVKTLIGVMRTSVRSRDGHRRFDRVGARAA